MRKLGGKSRLAGTPCHTDICYRSCNQINSSFSCKPPDQRQHLLECVSRGSGRGAKSELANAEVKNQL